MKVNRHQRLGRSVGVEGAYINKVPELEENQTQDLHFPQSILSLLLLKAQGYS